MDRYNCNVKHSKSIVTLMLLLLTMAAVIAVAFTYSRPQSASAASWDIVPVEEVYVTSEGTSEVNQGGKVYLNSETVPQYAIYTAQNIKYEIVSGSRYASIDGAELSVNSDADVGSNIIVRSIVDGVVSKNTLTFTVAEIPVKAIKILNTETSIIENGTLALHTEILPYNATNRKVIYTITEGGLYATVNGNGVITVKDKLPRGNISITVKATVGNDTTIYAEQSFSLYVPIRDIKIGNSDITEVEQRQTYDFSGIIEDNVSNNALTYSLNVGEDIATINESGILSISDNATIGAEIEITIHSVDIDVTHTVKVVAVHATAMRLDSIHNQDGEEVLESDKVYAGDVLDFDIAFPTPFNVTESLKTYCVELYDGDVEVAKVGADGKSIGIVEQDEITKKSPTFTVKIYSPDNLVAEPIYRSFTVFIAVTGIDSVGLLSTVYADEQYAIAELLSTTIYPVNSDMREITYSIGEGNGYAYITDNKLIHICGRDGLPDGNCKFTVIATIEGFNSVQSFSIYVEAETINYTIENLSDSRYPTNPMSTKTVGNVKGIGEKIRITLSVDEKATSYSPEIRVKTGDNLITEFSRSGNVITFIVTPDSVGSVIQLSAYLDNIDISLPDIVIYRPVQEISAITQTYESESGRYLLSRDDYTKNELKNLDMGTDWTIESEIGTVDLSNRSMPILQIPTTTKAGTAVKFTIFTNDSRYQFSQMFTFYVEKLNTSVFKYGVGGNIISFPYGKDSNGVAIDKDKPELWVGRSTTVNITTSNGLGLNYYGLTASGTVITMPSTASGDYSLTPQITIVDGTNYDGSINRYVLTLPTLYAFKPLKGVPKIVDGTVAMTSNGKVLQLTSSGTDFDTTATYKLTDLVMYGSSLSCAKLSGTTLTITSDSADSIQTIVLQCAQYYNGVELVGNDAYYETVTQKVKRITLYKQSGSGGSDSVLAVDGMQTSVSVPSRTGYIFGGYYSSTGGSGTQYYDANGKLKVTHSLYSCTALYAKWTAITYTAIGRVYVNGSYNKTSYTDTWTYNEVRKIWAEGDGFLYFLVNGIKYTDNPSYVSNLTTTQGATVYVDAYFENSCVASGTLITLADGAQKAVEDLDGSEMLLVWNMLTGSFDAAPILFIVSHGEREYVVTHLYFSDGTEVKVIYEHGFWDFDLNEYVYLRQDNAEEYLGHWFNKQYVDELGNLAYMKVQLKDVTVEKEWTNAWSPVTYSYLCYYVNGMLSMPDDTQGLVNYFIVDPDTMMFDIEAMNNDIDLYGLFTYEDFADLITEEMFYAFNGQYLKVAMGKGLLTEDMLMDLIRRYLSFFDDSLTHSGSSDLLMFEEVAYE